MQFTAPTVSVGGDDDDAVDGVVDDDHRGDADADDGSVLAIE